jgi:WD40 repeat protein
VSRTVDLRTRWKDTGLGRLGEKYGNEHFQSLHFAPDGKSLIVVGNRTMAFVDPQTGKTHGTLELPFRIGAPGNRPAQALGFRNSALPIAFSADASRYACVLDGELSVVDFEKKAKGKELFSHKLVGKDEPFAALSPNGELLALPDADRRAVEIWDVGTGKKLKSLAPPAPAKGPAPQFEDQLVFSPDGKTLFAGTSTKGAYRWDVGSGEMLPSLLRHSGFWAPRVHASPDGKTLMTVAGDGVFRRFDPATGTVVGEPHGYNWYTKIALSPDGKTVIVGDGGGSVDLWDLAGKGRSELKSVGGASVLSVRFSPDRRTVAAALTAGVVQVWDVRTRQLLKSYGSEGKGFGERIRSIAYLPTGDLIVASAAGGVHRWDVNADRAKWTRDLHGIEDVIVSPDGKWIATNSLENRDVQVLDAATGQTRHRWKGSGEQEHGWTPGRSAFTPDSRRLLTTHYDGKVREWDLATDKVLASFGVDRGGTIWEVVVSPDGRWAATSGHDEVVRVWELVTGKQVLERKAPGATGTNALFTPDGRRLLTSGWCGAMVWSLDPNKPSGDREAMWSALMADNPAIAYRAQWGLLQSGPDLAKFLREKVGPAVPMADEKTIRAWIAELDSDMFREREAATRQLAQLGRGAESVLREVQLKPISDEQGKRINQLLARLTGDRPLDDLRLARVVQVLGLIGDPDADRILAEWSKGATAAPLTVEAQATLAMRRDR